MHLMKGLTDKGLGKAQYKDNVLEMLEEKHDPTANIRPYLMASFGSAWAVVKVNIGPSRRDKIYLILPR